MPTGTETRRACGRELHTHRIYVRQGKVWVEHVVMKPEDLDWLIETAEGAGSVGNVIEGVGDAE